MWWKSTFERAGVQTWDFCITFFVPFTERSEYMTVGGPEKHCRGRLTEPRMMVSFFKET